jgi:hypothetical protein
MEGTEIPGNRILNFLRHFVYDFVLIYFSKIKPSLLKYIANSTPQQMYVTLCFIGLLQTTD